MLSLVSYDCLYVFLFWSYNIYIYKYILCCPYFLFKAKPVVLVFVLLLMLFLLVFLCLSYFIVMFYMFHYVSSYCLTCYIYVLSVLLFHIIVFF